MKREEAINIVRNIYQTDKEKEALATLIPELRESEDERIRKELKEAFEAYDIESKWNGIPIRSIFAWLEKQKEKSEIPIMDGDTDTYFDDLRMTTKPLTSREWFDEGIKYAQRLQKEQKPEWSEEDEEMLEYVIGDLNDAKQLFHAKDAKDLCDKEIAWLKSRRPSWKPSEEQMAALEAATVRYQSTGLESLFEDLKKL